VIGYLDTQASKNESRFWFARVDTITKRCTRYSRDKKPYSKTAVEQALAYFESLGIIARVRNMELKHRTIHGFVVAPHDHCCCRIGNRCEFRWHALLGFNWNKSDVTVTGLNFNRIQLFGQDNRINRNDKDKS
jgi:hypothetical protein